MEKDSQFLSLEISKFLCSVFRVPYWSWVALWQPWSLDFQWTQWEVEDNVPSLGILLLHNFPHKLLEVGALMICISRAVCLARNAQEFFQLLIPKHLNSQISRKIC